MMTSYVREIQDCGEEVVFVVIGSCTRKVQVLDDGVKKYLRVTPGNATNI